MKKTITIILLLFMVAFAQAQRKKEFQIRGGFGFAGYATTSELTYTPLNISTKNDDGAATVHLPLELRYEFSPRFNAGLDMKWGSYFYDPDSSEGKSNKFFVIGIGFEYNFISHDDFRWYGGIGFNTAQLELEENSAYSKRIINYSGPGFRLNTGVLWYFISGLGLNANLGYDTHNFSLDDVSDNGQSLDLSDLEGTLDVKGVDLTVGLAIRF